MKLPFCAACGTTIGLDHHYLRPRAHGGSDAETNLITLCHECHERASKRARRARRLAKTPIEARDIAAPSAG